jgi:hypothetical protein
MMRAQSSVDHYNIEFRFSAKPPPGGYPFGRLQIEGRVVSCPVTGCVRLVSGSGTFILDIDARILHRADIDPEIGTMLYLSIDTWSAKGEHRGRLAMVSTNKPKEWNL